MSFKQLVFTACLALFTLSLSSSIATAQSASPAITVSTVADVSADAVWTQIRKMDNIADLSSFVAKVSWKGPKGVGGERRCTAPDDQGYYIERIERFDDDQRSYSWEVVEGVPAKEVHNSIRVVDLGYNRSMIVFTSNYTFVENPNMTPDQFKAFLSNASLEMLTQAVALAHR